MLTRGHPARAQVRLGREDSPAAPVDPASSEPASPTWVRAAIGGSVAVALVNAGIGLGSRSVGRDEGFSISTSLRSWSSLIHLSLHAETNSWLYAFGLRAWSEWGTSPAFLRAPSVVAMLAVVVLTALLARQLFGDLVAVAVAAAGAVNGSLLMYAVQIRGYMLGTALVVAGTLCLVADVRRPRRGMLIGWAAFMVLAAQAQLHAFAVLPAQVLALAVLPPALRQGRRRGLAALLAVLAVMPTALAVVHHDEGGSLTPVGWDDLREVLNVFGGHGRELGVVGLAVTLLLAQSTMRRSWSAGGIDRFGAALVASWMVLPLLLLLVTSTVQPTLHGRYVVHSVPSVVMAVGLAVRTLRDARLRPVVAGATVTALFVLMGWGSVAWHRDSGTEPWNTVAAFVFQQARSGDRLVTANDEVRLYLEYERTRQPAEPPAPAPGFPSQPWGQFRTGDHSYRSPTEAELLTATDGADRLWVIVAHTHMNTDVMAERLTVLSPSFVVAGHWQFPSSIDVWLYERSR